MGGRSEFIVIKRDSDSKRGGFIIKSYIKMLKEGLLLYYNGICEFQ